MDSLIGIARKRTELVPPEAVLVPDLKVYLRPSLHSLGSVVHIWIARRVRQGKKEGTRVRERERERQGKKEGQRVQKESEGRQTVSQNPVRHERQ